MLALSDRQLPLLITGATGVVGFNAFPYFQARYPDRVIGIRPRENRRLVTPGIVGVDADDAPSLAALFRRYKFRAILHCSGNCALRACELDPAMARRINVEGTRNLLTAIADQPIRLVHLSTDLVFSGSRPGDYAETDAVDPVTVYGKTMVEGEELVLSTKPDALILRISLPMGPSFNGHAGAIDWIQSRFKKTKPATLYFDEVRTPTYTDDMNQAFERLLASDLSGLYHFGGPRRVTLYQIAQIVNRVGGYRPDLLLGCPRSQAGPIPPRAGNVSLDSSKIERDFGPALLRPWPNNDALVPAHERWHFERDAFPAGTVLDIHRYLYRCA